LGMKNHIIKISLVLLFIFRCEKNLTENESNDGLWSFSKPEAQRLNPQILDSAFVNAQAKGFIDGLMVIRNGYIVSEKYFNGYDEFQPHNIMSVSKSFLSAIVGIAIDQGYIKSLDEKMLDYFPEYISSDLDPRKYDITIRHLLTMRMGIKDESDDDYGVYWDFYHSDNWIKKVIESPLVFNPGEKMRYNTFQTHLLSAIIAKTTRQSTFDFAAKVLCTPLKISIHSWEQDPQGVYFGGNSMFFTPREMAMLGYLYLKNGKLNDQQIVPESWIDLTLSPSTNMAHPNEWGAFKNYNYAYLWLLGQINQYDLFMGYGYGGQFVVVFPDLNLIVVSTAKSEVDPDKSTIQEWAIFEIISKYILPAIGN
jgi:CubicO group peptidase (beta-lactamase class C family)